MKKLRKRKTPSYRERLRRQKQSEECLGVSYKDGYKFTKLKSGGYRLESIDENVL